jgi:hypothetical protein
MDCELSNRDKHRILNLSASIISGATYWEGPGADAFINNLIYGTFKDGAEVSRFPLPAGTSVPQMNVDFTITFGVALEKPGPGHLWNLPGPLRRIREFIRADIENPFKALLAE